MHRLVRYRSRALRRAFTLIEVMIVVVIVGVLAVLGVIGYRRYVTTAHTAEATHLTGGIRAAQEAFKVEKGIYADVSADTSSLYPAAAPGAFKTEWGGNCNNCKGDPNAWKQLAVHPAGPVMYGYATVAGVGGADLAAVPPPPKVSAASFAPMGDLGGGGGAAPIKATDPFYVTVAWGDTDADGNPCVVMSYSTSNQLVIQSAGE